VTVLVAVVYIHLVSLRESGCDATMGFGDFQINAWEIRKRSN